ncbi:MAG: homoserine O-succinyltransferase [Alphaproteobacteria bacterium]|nr:homoserine O-succinyltransferase [Alphaproteobacteria bacterium]
MPIKVPDRLPTAKILEGEGVELIQDATAVRQDIRPMRILLLNLMPMKVKTEVQIARLLSHTPLQVELSLLTTASYIPTTTPAEYLKEFYRTLEQVREERFDGMVITGAPVERMPFEEVAYWQELREIFEWAKRHVFRRFHICWGAQAALYVDYGIGKVAYPDKLFGIYPQRVREPHSPLLRGFPDEVFTPVSRYTGISREDVAKHSDLRILLDSDETGLCLLQNRRGDVYIMNHLEYDTDTLKDEYVRDLTAESHIAVPKDYFPGNDPSKRPVNMWRPYGYLLFSNWIYHLYEDTPYDLRDLDKR